jgi:hypothetical protein
MRVGAVSLSAFDPLIGRVTHHIRPYLFATTAASLLKLVHVSLATRAGNTPPPKAKGGG